MALPWAGCQFTKEMESALRHGQEQSLQATAQAVATVLEDRADLLYPGPYAATDAAESHQPIYAMPVPQAMILDGYADGWSKTNKGHFAGGSNAPSLALTYQAVTYDKRLFMLFEITDPDIVFHNPGLSAKPNGDHLVLRTWRRGQRQEYIIFTAAPGKIQTQALHPLRGALDANHIRGHWQDTAQGYTLELEMPLSFTGGRLGFYSVNATDGLIDNKHTLGNTAPGDIGPPPRLIYSPERLLRTIQPFMAKGGQLQVVDKSGWGIANTGQPEADPSDYRDEEIEDQPFRVVRSLYRGIVQREATPIPLSEHFGKVAGDEIEAALTGNSTASWYEDPGATNRSYLSVAVPITADGATIGALIARESNEAYLALTDKAFSRLLAYSLAALALAGLGLIGYASLLSWRIGRLSQAAQDVVDDDGNIRDSFPRSAARDEIGELSRRYADLLHRIGDYNEYLRTLSRKLSHELRTPIAVIQSSLDNLEHDDARPEDDMVYIHRARSGLSRLNQILTAMSEASQLEESIRRNDLAQMDLVPLIREIFAAYSSIYTDHQLTLICEVETAITTAAPELLVQALDKLMDNAVSFCPSQGNITLQLTQAVGGWTISVSNTGPPLPEAMQNQIFAPMVSVREAGSEGVHLGLGLHIVRLISDYHGATMRAENATDGSGVVVSVYIPGA